MLIGKWTNNMIDFLLMFYLILLWNYLYIELHELHFLFWFVFYIKIIYVYDCMYCI